MSADKRWTSHHIRDGRRQGRWFLTRWQSNNNPNDPTDERDLGRVTVEMSVFPKGHGTGFDICVDNAQVGCTVTVGRVVFAHASVGGWRLRALTDRLLPVHPGYTFRDERRISVRAHDGALFWSLWREPHVWKNGDRWSSSWRPSRTLFGKDTCETVVLQEGACLVPMVERTYPAVWQEEQRTWTYERFRKPRTRTSYNVRVDGGIPVAGKGENSWDCGDDGIWGTGGDTLEDAIANVVRAVLRGRRRHGMPSTLTGSWTGGDNPKVLL